MDPSLDIHVIADNDATHKAPRVRSLLLRNPRFHVHVIPPHSSWLNQVACWFSVLTEKQLKRGSHTSVPQFEAAIQAVVDAHNRSPTSFRSVKTAEEVLANVARLCATMLGEGSDIHRRTSDSTHEPGLTERKRLACSPGHPNRSRERSCRSPPA